MQTRPDGRPQLKQLRESSLYADKTRGNAIAETAVLVCEERGIFEKRGEYRLFEHFALLLVSVTAGFRPCVYCLCQL